MAGEAPTRETRGLPLPRVTAIRPRQHPASARDCDSAVAQVRPPPPAAPPPPLPHSGGQPGSTRGSGVGLALPEKGSRGARWGRGAARASHEGTGARGPLRPGPVGGAHPSRSRGPTAGAAPVWVGPCPSPYRSCRGMGLRLDTEEGDPGRERGVSGAGPPRFRFCGRGWHRAPGEGDPRSPPPSDWGGCADCSSLCPGGGGFTVGVGWAP